MEPPQAQEARRRLFADPDHVLPKLRGLPVEEEGEVAPVVEDEVGADPEDPPEELEVLLLARPVPRVDLELPP